MPLADSRQSFDLLGAVSISQLGHNKARSVGPGLVSDQPWGHRGRLGTAARGCCLATAVIVGSGYVRLWSELPALAPGSRYPSGRSAGCWTPGEVQWTATGLFPQTRDTPGTSHLVKNVGAGAGSSARSFCLVRGCVVHQRSLRIPLTTRWSRQRVPARATAHSTPVFIAATGVHEVGFMAPLRPPWLASAGSQGLADSCAPAVRVWGHRQRRPWRC